jgi:hypothetical protein
MRVDGYASTTDVHDEAELIAILATRDARGGALLWLSHDASYPTLAIRISGQQVDIHYFPNEGHPGFRCLANDMSNCNEDSVFIFKGCDPATGEIVPSEFVVPIDTVNAVALEYFRSGKMSSSEQWFEL